jgi:peptide/nickel transport system substrate-binding protein
MLGWGVATFDALYSHGFAHQHGRPQGRRRRQLQLRPHEQPRASTTAGGQQIKTEMDPAKRSPMIHEALQIVKDDYNYLPLHDQIRPWAMRKGVTTVHRPDDRPMAIWTTVK